LPERNSWIFWDKCSSQSFRSAGEFIWTSFNHPAAVCRFAWNGHYRCGPRIGKHPHEKPVELYKWILANYARHGWSILDTHLGSGTLAIACHDAGLDVTACEIDENYYTQAMSAINTHIAQKSLFPVKETSVFQSLFEEAV
jgi:site-specific DNA-methyltransferase (adenine-specific)